MLAGLGFLEVLWLLVKVRHQQGVFVVESVQVLQHRRSLDQEAVVPQPLQVTDLHGDLRQFVGVRVDLDGAELVNAHFRRELEAEPCGKADDLLLQVQQAVRPILRGVQDRALDQRPEGRRLLGRRGLGLQRDVPEFAPVERHEFDAVFLNVLGPREESDFSQRRVVLRRVGG